MRNILIIENDIGWYKGIKENLEKYLNEITVYPKNEVKFNEMINLLKTDYKELLKIEDYTKIDIFIVDQQLFENVKGSSILKLLETENYMNGDFDYMLTSQGSVNLSSLGLNKYNTDGYFISKGGMGAEELGESFVDEINNWVFKKTIKMTDKKLNRYKRFKQFVYKKLPIEINFLIILLFYILMVISVFYCAYGIINTGYYYIFEHPEKEKGILVIVENIFFYVLPIFIILGFFNYYKQAIRHRITGIEDDPNENSALDVLNNSKMIFLSSVLSYIIIKTIEKLFVDNSKLETLEVIAYGVFIIILMAYILLYHKQESNHKKNKKDEEK